MPRRRQRSVQIDGAAGGIDHGDLESGAARILGRIAHAKIEGETDEMEPAGPAFAQITLEAGRGYPVILEKSGIGIDRRVEALAQHQPGPGMSRPG